MTRIARLFEEKLFKDSCLEGLEIHKTELCANPFFGFYEDVAVKFNWHLNFKTTVDKDPYDVQIMSMSLERVELDINFHHVTIPSVEFTLELEDPGFLDKAAVWTLEQFAQVRVKIDQEAAGLLKVKNAYYVEPKQRGRLRRW